MGIILLNSIVNCSEIERIKINACGDISIAIEKRRDPKDLQNIALKGCASLNLDDDGSIKELIDILGSGGLLKSKK